MSNELTRFSITMPEDLLQRFDELVARRGTLKNRSEIVRDLVRDALVADDAASPGAEVMGSLTIVYNHHESNVTDRLHDIQHERYGMVVSTTHVHLNEEDCLEVIILRGESSDVRAIAERIRGTKGVQSGGLVIAATGQQAQPDSSGQHGHRHGHDHPHDHGHDHPHAHDHAHDHDHSHVHDHGDDGHHHHE